MGIGEESLSPPEIKTIGSREIYRNKWMRVRENALYLVFKLVCRLSTNWRTINAPNQLTLLLAGHRFVDGRLHLVQPTQEDQAA